MATASGISIGLRVVTFRELAPLVRGVTPRMARRRFIEPINLARGRDGLADASVGGGLFKASSCPGNFVSGTQMARTSTKGRLGMQLNREREMHGGMHGHGGIIVPRGVGTAVAPMLAWLAGILAIRARPIS